MNDEYRLTDYDIQALIDNELDEAEHNFVIMALNANPFYKKRYHQLLKQKELLNIWYAQMQGGQEVDKS